MTDSLFDRCGWNPTEVHARLYGQRPRGIIVVTAEQRAHAEREAKERERAEAAPPPVEVKAEEPNGSAVPPLAAEDGADGPGAAGVRPKGAHADAETDTLVCEWLAANWQAVQAMARAGVKPDSPAVPPRDGEVADASAADGEGSPPVAASHEAASPDHHPADGPPPRAGEEPAPPPPRPPVHVAKGDRWNKHKMTNFLRELAATHSVSAAAKAVGMSRESAHRLRNRLKGQPFDLAWEAASRHGYDALTDAAIDRAVNGVEVPHYHNGEVVGTHRKYSDALLIALLKLRNDRGAPQVGRYGAAAEWLSERWDASLERVETGSVDWSDEHRSLGKDGLADLRLPTEDKLIGALIQKHAPLPDHRSPMRK